MCVLVCVIIRKRRLGASALGMWGKYARGRDATERTKIDMEAMRDVHTAVRFITAVMAPVWMPCDRSSALVMMHLGNATLYLGCCIQLAFGLNIATHIKSNPSANSNGTSPERSPSPSLTETD